MEKTESIRARIGKIQEIKIYHVLDSELDNIEKGPSTLRLTFATFLISISISFIIALATTTISSDRTFSIFVVIVVSGGIIGLYILMKAIQDRKSFSNVVAVIRERASATSGYDVALSEFLRLMRNLVENNKFLSVKWLREKRFGYNKERQELLQSCIDRKIILLERISNPNPDKKRFPLTICKLNREHQVVQKILGDTLK